MQEEVGIAEDGTEETVSLLQPNSSFGEMHPSIINVFEAQSWTRTVWRNHLNIPKLPHHPLWSVYGDNGTLSDMSIKA